MSALFEPVKRMKLLDLAGEVATAWQLLGGTPGGSLSSTLALPSLSPFSFLIVSFLLLHYPFLHQNSFSQQKIKQKQGEKSIHKPCERDASLVAYNGGSGDHRNSFDLWFVFIRIWCFHKHVAADQNKRNGNYYVFRRGVSSKPLFSWSDHPSLITDAVENGWSRFGFTPNMSSPSTRSSRLGLRAPSDHARGNGIEVNWEVSERSVDFMQKIRLKSGSRKGTRTITHDSMAASSVIRTALPLPGPPLGNSAFPQEAYFEIKILYCQGHNYDSSRKLKESEMTKLMHENSSSKASSESFVHVINKIEELKSATKDDRKGEAVMFMDLKSVRGCVFGRDTFIVVTDITDAIAVTAGVVNVF
ncbi:uncharacterized protein LOC120138293 [Hibiscus syriacus]|uniref:uncharacterized protein LOC120138293 n=1 Tax=Hibiscus syriacus TaxID=106335 RepID=UPI001921E85A|nr:uncharacterized protein LOC120138293 [Hibiscus syriacus]